MHDDEGEVGAAAVVADPCAHVLLLHPDTHLAFQPRTDLFMLISALHLSASMIRAV